MARTSGIDTMTVAQRNHWKNQPRAPRGVDIGGQWVEDGSTVFHGTSEDAIDSVLQNGLKASDGKTYGKKGYVYVTSDLEGAKYWGEDHLDNVGINKEETGIVIFSVSIPKGANLQPDTQSHGSGGADKIFKGSIPPEWITGYQVYRWDGTGGNGWVVTSKAKGNFYAPTAKLPNGNLGQ